MQPFPSMILRPDLCAKSVSASVRVERNRCAPASNVRGLKMPRGSDLRAIHSRPVAVLDMDILQDAPKPGKAAKKWAKTPPN